MEAEAYLKIIDSCVQASVIGMLKLVVQLLGFSTQIVLRTLNASLNPEAVITPIQTRFVLLQASKSSIIDFVQRYTAVQIF